MAWRSSRDSHIYFNEVQRVIQLESILGNNDFVRLITYNGSSIGLSCLLEFSDLHQVTSLSPHPPISISSDLSSVPKYIMPTDIYATLPDTVLAYKKTHQIGRFDPNAPEAHQRKIQGSWKEIHEKRRFSPPKWISLCPEPCPFLMVSNRYYRRRSMQGWRLRYSARDGSLRW